MTLRQFTKSEKQELIEYLHSDCDEDDHKQFLKDSTLGEFIDYVDASYDNELMYSQFVVRFVDLLNVEDACYRKIRGVVRKQWEQRSLPKCQMKAICDYVATCVTRSEDQARAKRYLATRQSSDEEFKRVAERINTLQKALQEEDASLMRKFKFPPLSKDISPSLALISGCLDAIRETRRVHRASYSEQRFGYLRYALQKIHAARALANPHSDATQLRPEQVAEMMPVIHEVIAGKFPHGGNFNQYSTANLTTHARRLNTRTSLINI